MKKVLVFALIALLSTSMLFAGGSSESTQDDPNTLTMWVWDESFNIPAAEAAAEIYKQKNPDFNLEITNITFADITTRLTTAIFGGQEDTLPDIMLMNDINIKKFVTLYPGYFLDLSDSGINFDDFAQYKVQAATVDGGIYAVPFDAGTSVAFYNIELLEEAGLTIEDLTDLTWEEYIAVTEPAVQKTGLPMVTIMDPGQHLINCMLQSGGSWYFDENDNAYISGNKVMEETFRIFKELVDKGIVQIRSSMEEYYSSYYDGSTMGAINACWVLNNLVKDPSQSGKWRVTNMPRFSNIEGAANAGNTGGSSWVVMANGKTDLAIDYLKETFAGSPELYNELLTLISCVGTYTPASTQPNYNMGVEFFGGQQIYSLILEMTDEVPRANYGLYTAEAQDAVGTALTQYRTGSLSLEDALAQAQQTLEFLMQ